MSQAATPVPDPVTARVLVTGAAGFVGSRVVEMLAGTTDHRVIALDVVESPRLCELASLPAVDFRAMDLRDTDALESVVSETDAIVHLAAVRTQAAKKRPKDAHDINVGTTYDLLSAATKHGVRRFVFGSTNTIYGPYQDPATEPVREDRPWVPQGINMYAATKLASEAYLEAFAGLGGPEYIALRIGPIYGPRVSPGSNGSLSVEILHALDRSERPIVSWARDSVHSFVYIDDVAKAIVASLSAAQTGLAVNVVGAPVTAETFCSRIVELYGHDPSQIEWKSERTRYQRVSQGRMREVLGFAPETTLDEGLQSVINWHRKQSQPR
ncbi:UDP-glucose 4-epimerase [Kribbella sp. VKM Ac-2527]|uniref:UDP-glucose 4-epimerase n=1 Tax=Kribbella caucasensis TaxID=2512215 RepID=A0A4R6KMN5_9ACTN|nr:NAD(P)-dependent oxidoreductase [Kribbella sp. VKM Ac-2527]TDO51675.1 UDP-glucose 4-epimerase [Kribbella sp. VKM Ac-2527]